MGGVGKTPEELSLSDRWRKCESCFHSKYWQYNDQNHQLYWCKRQVFMAKSQILCRSLVRLLLLVATSLSLSFLPYYVFDPIYQNLIHKLFFICMPLVKRSEPSLPNLMVFDQTNFSLPLTPLSLLTVLLQFISFHFVGWTAERSKNNPTKVIFQKFASELSIYL